MLYYYRITASGIRCGFCIRLLSFQFEEERLILLPHSELQSLRKTRWRGQLRVIVPQNIPQCDPRLTTIFSVNKIVESSKFVQRADDTDGMFEHNSVRVLLAHVHNPAYVAQLIHTNEC